MAVTVADIATELGRPTPDPDSVDAKQWARWIDQAYLLISTRLGDLTALDEKVVDYVVSQAVAAHVKRPDDYTQVDVRIDDGQSTRRYESAAGRVVILPEWWSMLSPSGRTKAFSVDLAQTTAVPTLEDVLRVRPDLRFQWAWPAPAEEEPWP